jgi:two-component sensor histidine kinase
VTGERNAETFTFRWRERGGPRVAPPARKGYGQTILEDGARHIGEPVIAYAAEGLEYDLRAPLKAIGWSLAGPPARAMFWPSSRPRR